MTKPNVIFIGASGHAKVCIDILEQQNRYKLVGCLDKTLAPGTFFFDYPILGSDDQILSLIKHHQITHAFVAIGDNFVRSKVVQKIKALWPTVQFATLIHPTATLAKEVKLGTGSVIMPHASIGPSCTIGAHCILNTHASIDHDCTLGDFASLAPHAGTGGHCHLEQGSFMGIGSHLKHGITVGEHTVIGGGSYVHTPLDSHSLYYGTPARFIRHRQPSDSPL